MGFYLLIIIFFCEDETTSQIWWNSHGIVKRFLRHSLSETILSTIDCATKGVYAVFATSRAHVITLCQDSNKIFITLWNTLNFSTKFRNKTFKTNWKLIHVFIKLTSVYKFECSLIFTLVKHFAALLKILIWWKNDIWSFEIISIYKN